MENPAALGTLGVHVRVAVLVVIGILEIPGILIGLLEFGKITLLAKPVQISVYGGSVNSVGVCCDIVVDFPGCEALVGISFKV
jgi:hypothetical protein